MSSFPSVSVPIKTDIIPRIDDTFSRLHSGGKKGLICYITAGDPSLEKTIDVILALERAGVDILELGIPFSDPVADGPAIQAASQRAIQAGATVERILELVSLVRQKSSLPIVLFTYLNPIYTYGFKKFDEKAAAVGADGLLVLDLPPQESELNKELNFDAKLQRIQLIGPTTDNKRIASIVLASQGFVYCISQEGVTGIQGKLPVTLASQVQRIRKLTSLPIAVGFGISMPDQVKAVTQEADAVVVGSALVRCIAKHSASPDLSNHVEEFVRPLVEATRQG